MDRALRCAGLALLFCCVWCRASPQHYLLGNIPAATDNSFVWNMANGAYRFGMKTPEQWRVETRDEGGAVQGQYFYRTPDGGEVNMHYNSGASKGGDGDGTTLYQHQDPGVTGTSRSDTPQHFQRPWLTLNDRVGGGGEVLTADSKPLHLTQEELLPYGALRVAGQDLHQFRAADPSTIEDLQLQAIVTEVLHQ